MTLVDINPSRAKLAQAFGAAFAAPDAAPSDCDVVVHASGTAPGLSTALNLAGDEATVLELSWYGADGAGAARGSFSQSALAPDIEPGRQSRAFAAGKFTPRSRLEFALKLTAAPELDVLLEPAVAFADLPEKLPNILAPFSAVLCQRIDYS